MDENEDEYLPGLHDPASVPKEQRVERYKEHLLEWVDFELAVHMAAISAITLKDIEDGLSELQHQGNPAREIEKSIQEAFDFGRAGLEIGRESDEKLQAVLKEKIDRKSSLSKAGTNGAQSLHRPAAELKSWALSQATIHRGSDKDIARKLAAQIPKHLADASKDPERLIYDALRAAAKQN